MTWHASEQLMTAYVHDQTDEVAAASVEAHLVSCGDCRTLLTQIAAPSQSEPLEVAWADIVDRLDQPPLGLIERLLLRLGVVETDAKIIATTPALRLSWFAAIAVAVIFAVWAAHNGSHDPIMFLTIAPFVPLAGVALAFGPVADPMHETSVAAPISATRILAMRALAVGVLSAAILIPATLTLAVGHPIAAAWIAPALAVVSLALCLASRFGIERGAAAAATLWAVAVPMALFTSRLRGGAIASHVPLFGFPVQIGLLTFTAFGGIYAWRHRDAIADSTRWETSR